MDKKRRHHIYGQIGKTITVALANVLLAFAVILFFTKLNIVAGGIGGIGVIFQALLGPKFGQVIDIVVFILTWSLWVISYFVLGKEFAIKTLVSAIVYPIAVAIFARVEYFDHLANVIAYYPSGDPNSAVSIGNILVCAIFGGMIVGASVGLSFLGGGSTGGADVIVAIIAKYTNIKESHASFMVDGTIIFVSALIIPNNLIPAMCGILSAMLTALLIELIYVQSYSSYQVDIISEKWEEISSFAQNELDRGCTLIPAKGGYKGEDRLILRVVLPKEQYSKFKNFIADTDDRAFVTITQTNAVYGEGFSSHQKKK